MAEALKTFREGEDILASETNDNNQYLLSRLSDNAAQVQQYVEGEVATIKSNVSSVQATLQNNINELKALLDATIATMLDNSMPDYSKGVALASGSVVPVNAVGYCMMTSSSYGEVKIDGTTVFYQVGQGSYRQRVGTTFLIPKGSTVTYSGVGSVRYFPLKGEKEKEV
jgi:hypothetical protein